MKKFFTCVIAFAWIFPAQSQPGTLDPTFGLLGIALGPFVSDLSHGNAIAQQADGKLLVAGHILMGGDYDMFIVRYYPTGSLDLSFGINGSIVESVGNSSDYGRAIAVQADGKIVVAGDFDNTLSSVFFLKRYDVNGDSDNSFGSGGTVITDFGSNTGDEAKALVIQADGKIVLAGWSFLNDKDIALIRYNSTGTLDSTFGVNGKVATDISQETQKANAIALQSDGKIVVAGFTHSSSSFNDAAIFRYISDGSLDSTFDDDGIVVPVINDDDDEANSVAIQPDGKIVVAGYTYNDNTFFDNLLMRFDTLGNLDPSFNSTGIVVSDINGFDNWSNVVLLQADGKIVTVGRSFSTTYDISLSRFLSDGQLDSTFGNSGHVATPIGIEDEDALDALLQPDNKIVVTGYYTDSGLENLFTCRYQNNSIPTSLGESEDRSSQIVLFPQPASEIIHIAGLNSVSHYTIEILSIASYQVQRIVKSSALIPINVSFLPAGTYLLKISDGVNIFYKPLVKN